MRPFAHCSKHRRKIGGVECFAIHQRTERVTLPAEVIGETAWQGFMAAMRTKDAGNPSVIRARAIVIRRSLQGWRRTAVLALHKIHWRVLSRALCERPFFPESTNAGRSLDVVDRPNSSFRFSS